MTTLAHAQALGAAGFHVFPIAPGTKKPMHAGWQDEATRAPTSWPDGANVGIFCERYGDDQALVAVDVDRKNGKNGDEALFALEIEGFELPPTFEQRTPTGGSHLIFVADRPVAPSVGKIGRAIDIRSAGSYIVGPGSVLPEGPYAAANRLRPAVAPAWLLERAGAPATRPDAPKKTDPSVARARTWLATAPIAEEGDGGDLMAFKIAAKVKDFGVPRLIAFDLMAEVWNPRCAPPWDLDELLVKVNNAYAYGASEPGVDDPRTAFTAIAPVAGEITGTPMEQAIRKINSEFAWVIAGGGSHILWETTDAKGRATLEHLSEDTFHKKHASWRVPVGEGRQLATRGWAVSADRREYDGLVFAPGGAPSRFFNLWRGFAVEPAATSDHASVHQWIDHARTNVCSGDESLFRWLVGFFAHLVQRPADKPLVALVFRGGKGVGKNALVERVGWLLGKHFLVTADRRYLTGNFNGHLERTLMLGLDEAFWSGDKQTEGIVKNLITGKEHVIEHKGKEPYAIDNLTRVVIIGNEDWIVPASHDERRFAVFNVGDGRKQDTAFFETMRVGMEGGGYACLLRYLLDFPISNVNVAPVTKALQDQKVQSLDIFDQWWLDCLTEGTIVGSDFGGGWPADISKARLMDAFRRYSKDSNVKSRFDSGISFGRKLRKVAPSIDASGKVKEATGTLQVNGYKGLDLARHRAEWNAYIKSEQEWPA